MREFFDGVCLRDRIGISLFVIVIFGGATFGIVTDLTGTLQQWQPIVAVATLATLFFLHPVLVAVEWVIKKVRKTSTKEKLT